MTILSKLIAKYCPNGVPFKSLGELGFFYGGLSGKSKSDFINGNAKLITYKNVYSNIEVDTEIKDRVVIKEDENQNIVQYGDILFTGSSETLDECGMSSVLTKEPDENLYLNSFCFGYRLYDKNLLLPHFSKYLFRSETVRKQIIRAASGVTRFNVSKKKMERVIIPLPPLPVQQEIVRILDSFTKGITELIKSLAKEIEMRRKQHEYYSKLIIENIPNFRYERLGDLGIWHGGNTPSKHNQKYWEGGTIPWVTSKDMTEPVITKTTDYITLDAVQESSLKLFPANTVAVVVRSGILRHTLPIAYVPFQFTVNQDIKALIPKPGVSTKYIAYAMRAYHDELLTSTKKKGGTVESIEMKKFLDFTIPIPPIEQQEQIVELLDRLGAQFDELIRTISAEIDARRNQYAYYRDKLLTFKEVKK